MYKMRVRVDADDTVHLISALQDIIAELHSGETNGLLYDPSGYVYDWDKNMPRSRRILRTKSTPPAHPEQTH